MMELVLSVVALGLGPLIAHLASRVASTVEFLDGLVLVAISGLVFLHIVPHAILAVGYGAVLVAVIGFLFPLLLERTKQRGAHARFVPIISAGFIVHAFIDGAALASHDEEHSGILAIAIVLHRLPDGLAIWSVVQPTRGERVAAIVLALLGAATVAGYFASGLVVGVAAGHAIALLQAFVAGSVLHIILHAPQRAQIRPHEHGEHDHAHHHPHHASSAAAAGIGAVVGLALLVLVTSSHPVVRRETNELEAGSTFIVLALDAAPAVLLAVIASGVIHAFVPDAMIARIGRGPSIVQALRGASVTAAIALLVGAPELGAPALMVSWALLGRSMTIARAASALFIAIAVSLVVGRLAKSQPAAPPPHADVATDRISAFRVGVTDVLEHTGPWLIAGLVVAALVEPMLRADMFAQLPAMAQVPILAVASMPFYVCASGATPLVAVLMHKGMAPGAALAFLVAGPASNLTTFGVLARLHGRKVAVVYVATITALAVVVGIIANVVVAPIDHAALHDVERRPASHVDIACLVMVTGLFVVLLLRRGPRHLLGQIVSQRHDAEHGELA